MSEHKHITATTTPTLAQSSDDSSSVGSLPYFHSSDFAESSWTNTIGYYGVPSIGLAVLALFHPLFFLAGAGVAAAGYGLYEVCHNGKKSQEEEPITATKDYDTSINLTPTARVSCGEVAPAESFYAPTVCTDMESFDPRAPLLNSILTNENFPGFTALEFFSVFFGNHAVFSFAEFQRKRGDVNIVYTHWIDQQRVLTFETPTKQIFGPAYAVARKDQQLRKNSKHCVVMESTTTLEKIPFCKTFCVREQWEFTSTRDSDGKPNTLLSVSAQVDFSSSNPFEGQIKSKSISTIRDVLGCWCKMAHEAVRLTQERAEERMKRQGTEPARDENAIEVAYIETRQHAAIVGEVDDEENDWEMDPNPAPLQDSGKTKRLPSFHAVRRSFSSKFLKKSVSTTM